MNKRNVVAEITNRIESIIPLTQLRACFEMRKSIKKPTEKPSDPDDK